MNTNHPENPTTNIEPQMLSAEVQPGPRAEADPDTIGTPTDEEVFLKAVREADADVAFEVPRDFGVRDAATASWTVRKILEARKYAEHVQGWALRELQRAEKDEQWLLRRFGTDLEAWLRAELARLGGKRRSIVLPGGTLGLRRTPAKVVVMDEGATATWCATHLPTALRVDVEGEGPIALALAQWQSEHSTALRIKRSVMRETLRKHVAESGELPDGTNLQPAHDKFFVA